MKTLLARVVLTAAALLLAGCYGFEDQVRAPTEQELQDARTTIKPQAALRRGVFNMQRIQQGSTVRVKDEIHLKKPDLPPFDVAYVNRNLEEVILELANAAGESVVLPASIRGQTVTLVHSGADFPTMLDLVLNKAGYSYNYVNGVWYITRYPVRNYILEIAQGDRKGSLTSKAELSPELAANTTTAGTSAELDSAYSDELWGQVKETLAELIQVGATNVATPALNATGFTASGQLLTANVSATQTGATGILPPPEVAGGHGDSQIFAGASQVSLNLPGSVGMTVATTPVSITAPAGTDHLASAETDATPWFKVTDSAGMITVRASPEAHRQIEAYLEEVQASALKQVIVEARIVALIRNKTTDRGVDLSSNLPQHVANTVLGQIGFHAASPLADMASGGGFFTLSSSGGDLGLVIQSLSTLGDVYTISTPTLLARNNQLSRVSVTRQLGYAQTDVTQNTTSTGDIVIGSRQDKALFKNSGTVMSVLPFIGRNRVQMRFRLSIASQAGSTSIKTAIGTQTPVENLVPEMANNVVDQDMVLEFGRIYAIGGLVEHGTNIAESYEPNLRQIPGLGEIFQRAKNTGSDTEFLILLKVSRA
jgi:type II secretory pathway component GspD/PulD (secretin)